MKIRTRIAPSPTGYPHIGTIYQALLDQTFAKKHNGHFVIRIEDTDQSRFVADAEQKLYEAFDWLNISEDESPRKEGEYEPYKQSLRLETYHKYAQQLIDAGHAYKCFCSPERLSEVRKQMQKAGKPPMYDRHCRNLSKKEVEQKISQGEKYVVRLKVPDNQEIIVKDAIRGEIKFNSNNVDDQVLVKSDGFPTYHLAVVVDDHLMQISHAVRGEEWLPSSPKHTLLYDFFDWQPPVWVHTPTLRNADKSKLSKRQGHTNVQWYRQQGFLPEAIINFLSQLGWTHPEEKEIFTHSEFVELFDFKDLSPAGPVFDEKKLRWMNAHYLRALSDQEIAKKLFDYLNSQFAKDFLSENEFNYDLTDLDIEKITELVPLIKERIEILSDIFSLGQFMQKNIKIDKTLVFKQNKQSDEDAKKLLGELLNRLNNLENWTTPEIEKIIRNIKGEFSDWKARDFFMTIRVATTGFPVTPPLFESVEVLEKDEVLQRLEQLTQTRFFL